MPSASTGAENVALHQLTEAPSAGNLCSGGNTLAFIHAQDFPLQGECAPCSCDHKDAMGWPLGDAAALAHWLRVRCMAMSRNAR